MVSCLKFCPFFYVTLVSGLFCPLACLLAWHRRRRRYDRQATCARNQFSSFSCWCCCYFPCFGKCFQLFLPLLLFGNIYLAFFLVVVFVVAGAVVVVAFLFKEKKTLLFCFSILAIFCVFLMATHYLYLYVIFYSLFMQITIRIQIIWYTRMYGIQIDR